MMTNRETASPLNVDFVKAYGKALIDLQGDFQEYSVLDYPDYKNIGDSAIWMGQRQALLDTFGRDPSYVASQNDYRQDLDLFCKDGILFIQGGGNFGDIWSSHQNFRLRLILEHPHRRIVQLSQSIHFSEPGAMEDTKAAIGKHRDFHFFVRDQASFDLANQQFDCPVTLVPDAAHCIPSYHGDPASHEYLSLIRTDKETLIPGLGDLLTAYGPVSDWDGIESYFYENIGPLDRIYRRHLQYKFPRSPLAMTYRIRMYNRLAQAAVDRGTALLSKGKTVISDRLHAHILCLLMAKPHISIDNANGKVKGYIQTWGSLGITDLVRSEEDLVNQLKVVYNAQKIYQKGCDR